MSNNNTDKKFSKGQIIYQAIHGFSSIYDGAPDGGDVIFNLVVSRLVDACGKKKITFYNRGGINNDYCYGRSTIPECPLLFATHAEAIAYLKDFKAQRKGSDIFVIDESEHSDADNIQEISETLKAKYLEANK